MRDCLVLGSKMTAVADPKMNNETVQKLWHGFSLTLGEIAFEQGEKNTFRLGEEPLPALSEGKEYALSVSEKGAAVIGKDFGGLMRGFLSLLMKMEYNGKAVFIKTLT